MIEKIMNDLKNEISVIKDESRVIDNYAYGRTGTFSGFTYRVILKNGTEFYISFDSYKIPEFDVCDIVYISKRFIDDIDDNFAHYIDTEIGEYCVNSGNYDVLIYKLFNVKNTIETGCFE